MLRHLQSLPLRVKFSILLTVGFSLYALVLLAVFLPRLNHLQEESYANNLEDNVSAANYVIETFVSEAKKSAQRIVSSTSFVDTFKEEDPTLLSLVTNRLVDSQIHDLGFIAWSGDNGEWSWSRSHQVAPIADELALFYEVSFKPRDIAKLQGIEDGKTVAVFAEFTQDFLPNETNIDDFRRKELVLLTIAPIYVWDEFRGLGFFLSIVQRSDLLRLRLDRILNFQDNERIAIQLQRDGQGFLTLGNQNLFAMDELAASNAGIDHAKVELDHEGTLIALRSDRSALGQAIQNQVQILSILFFFISLIFIAVILRLLLNTIGSLRDLVRTADLMKRGHLNARMSVNRTDELGRLALQFNEMAKSIEHKVRTIEQQALNEEELRKHKHDLELSQLKTQMKPHFLFNSLNMITSLIELDQESAVEVTIQLANLYRLILESSSKLTSPLTRELEIVQNYLAIQKKRFGNRLSFNIINPIKEKTAFLPQLILQTLVENAIKHGIEKRIEGGHIELRISQESPELYRATVTNTGRLEQDKIEDGTGLRNTKKILSHLYGSLGVIQFDQLDPDTVIFSFEFTGESL